MVDPHDLLKRTPAEKHWQSIGISPHHGIQIPLLAIHSSTSCGCGDFYDLYLMIDWIKSVGMDVIQLLPLNDSGLDPSPYNAQSASALHPIYLNLGKLPLLSKKLQEKLPEFTAYNLTVRVHYSQILEMKLLFLREYVKEVKEHFLAQEEYQKYLLDTDWLHDYALFKTLKTRFEELNWISWPEEYKNPSKTTRVRLLKEYEEEVTFYSLVQYLCYLQFKGVSEHAKAQGILLKGDIPILISPDSSDVWAHPELFDMTMAAGAPPDKFNEKWQYWGFPLYNWKAHRQENFRYWKSRLRYASHFYSMYRIDHVVGFFRIWGTKRGKHAKYGHFIPKERKYWLIQGEEILRMMLDASPMLPIAEDLGVVPDDVKERILSLGIPGTRVFRWEVSTETEKFIPFSQYTPLSLSTVSTHDTETLEIWWKEELIKAKEFASCINEHYESHLTPNIRRHILSLIHATPSLFHINLIQEYLAFYDELKWPNPEDERINVPGYVLPSNWTYKTAAPLETIVAHKGLREFLQSLSKNQQP